MKSGHIHSTARNLTTQSAPHKAQATKDPDSQFKTFEQLLGKEQLELVLEAMNNAGIAYRSHGRGKGEVLAALQAACDHFNKQPLHIMDWPKMLAELIPNSKWSDKNRPKPLADCNDRYQEVYWAVKEYLSK